MGIHLLVAYMSEVRHDSFREDIIYNRLIRNVKRSNMAHLNYIFFIMVIALVAHSVHGFNLVRPAMPYAYTKSLTSGSSRKVLVSTMQASNPDTGINIESKISRPNRIQNLQEKLASSGRAGLLAYGILNCVYYISVTAITCYITVKKYPFVISNSASFSQRIQLILSRLGSVAGTVWVGSQITKIFRLSGAVICAPVVDNLMATCQKYFKLPSRNAAFWFIVAALWVTVIVFYSSLVVYGTSTLYMSALESVL